ncbi:MAG: glycosyltransferase, partial [Polyangiaceae bacterium]
LKGEVVFTVHGPAVDPGYLERCKQLARQLPSNIRVEFRGPLAHEQVLDRLALQHVFLLPTVGESFSHAILESLLAGCVPIISDQTPWRDLARAGAGWDLPLADEAAFVRALQTCVDIGEEEFAARSAAARAMGVAAAASTAALEDNRALFEALRASG